MSDPINMNYQHQMRHATREMQEIAKRMGVMMKAMEAAQAELLAALEKRGPGRPAKVEAA